MQPTQDQPPNPKHSGFERETLIMLIKLQAEVQTLNKTVDTMRSNLASNFVTRNEFNPVRNLVYGAVGVILFSVFGALIALILT